MSDQSVKDFYDTQYRRHAGGLGCHTAIHDLPKARARLGRVMRALPLPAAGRALDVGSGLGYYTKALSMSGLDVIGLDFSDAAVSAARSAFPDCRFTCGAWPDDVSAVPEFDLIWMVNFSLMNTFDVAFIERQLIGEAMRRLKPGGCVVVGWNTNFSGRAVQGYSNWSIRMLDELSACCGLSAAFVPTPLPISWLITRLARAIGRSVPVFMVARKPCGG